MENEMKARPNVIRQLSEPEMEQVEGGIEFPRMIDPAIQCEFCGRCFDSKAALKMHYAKCPKKHNL